MADTDYTGPGGVTGTSWSMAVLLAALAVLVGCGLGVATATTATSNADTASASLDGADESVAEVSSSDGTAAIRRPSTAQNDTTCPDRAVSGDDTAGEAASDGEDELEIHHVNVGQADATLVVTPGNETILIDSGGWRQDGTEVIDYLRSRDVQQIDHLVATHAHADHVGGHAAVIQHFEENGDGVGTAYEPGVPHDTQTYEDYQDALDEYDVPTCELRENDELPVQSLNATVLNPPAGDLGDDLHETSFVLVLEHGDFRYLTTGDAEKDTEARLVEQWAEELDVDVYQAGLHGSAEASTSQFLDHVDPDVAVVSSDYESQHDHPHDETLERFDDADVETYWTGVHEDVVVTTNGTGYSVETESDGSTDPAQLLEEKPSDAEDAATASTADFGVGSPA